MHGATAKGYRTRSEVVTPKKDEIEETGESSGQPVAGHEQESRSRMQHFGSKNSLRAKY